MPSIDHVYDAVIDARIEVLLVATDERWARYLAQQLTQYDEQLSVTVVLSPNEVLQQLRGEASIDCLVMELDLPGIDGSALLEEVQEIDPELPIVLTAPDRESLTDILETGGTDICPKDGSTDQTSLFANRITAAVKRHRLERSIAETKQQYQTLLEQSSDAISIIQDETFVFWNQQLSDLTGYDNSQINTFYPAVDLFHPADRNFVRGKLADWSEQRERRTSHQARIVTEQGTTRHCELTGRPVTHKTEPAVLVSVTDATEQKRQQRELQWQKQLNETVQRALIDADTRNGIEERICEQLCQYGYELAWTGQIIDNAVKPRVVKGSDTTGVADRVFPLEDTDAAPNVWAARLKEPQFVNDLTGLFETEWQQTALQAGYRAGAAVPLLYEDIQYGVLVVYDDTPETFDDTERTLLRSLSELMAFAMHTIETRHALSAQRTVEIELLVRDTAYYLNELAQRPACRAEDTEFVVTGTIPHGDNKTIQYVTVDGIDIEGFIDLARDHAAVIDVTVVADSQDPRLQIAVEGPTPESRLATLGTEINATTVRIDGASLQIELPAVRDTTETVDKLAERFSGITLESIVESGSPGTAGRDPSRPTMTTLTEKQENALRVAFHHGYFEQPRKSTAKEIARTLEISHSTFLQHLRVAEQKLLTELYDQ